MKPEHYYLFTVGHSLVGYHTMGVLHGDIHPEHVLFQAAQGNPALIDAAIRDIDLSAKAVALDFVTPYATFERLHCNRDEHKSCFGRGCYIGSCDPLHVRSCAPSTW